MLAHLFHYTHTLTHSADVESPPPTPYVCMSIDTQGKPCSDLGRVLASACYPKP